MKYKTTGTSHIIYSKPAAPLTELQPPKAVSFWVIVKHWAGTDMKKSGRVKTSVLVSSLRICHHYYVRERFRSTASLQQCHLWFMMAWYSLWWAIRRRNTLYFLS